MRRPRAAKRRYNARHNPGTFAEPFARGIGAINGNPNRGKRHAAPLAYMDGFVAELERAQSRAYSPLTVVTPARDSIGRRAPRSKPSKYTI